MKKSALFLLLFYLSSTQFFAQVSPPGLGDANSASWVAMGLKQNIDRAKTIESMTYFGVGFTSNLDNENPIEKPSIYVLNQEFYHTLNNHWKISYALSYRNQKNYSKDNINTQQEARLYARAAYTTKINRVKLTQTLRQEVRKFGNENWKNTEKPFQLRSRYKTQVAITLDKTKKHTLTAGAEILLSTSKSNLTKKWSKMSYQESRFTLFYTLRPQKTPVAISFGYMNNLIQKKKAHSVHYASIDLVWENPFYCFSK